MRLYVSTFIVATVVVLLALAVALAPEIKQFLLRFRRPLQTERHLVRPADETGPRPPRPKLKREQPRNEAGPEEESPSA